MSCSDSPIGKEFFENSLTLEKTLEIPGEEKLVINLMVLDLHYLWKTVVTLVRCGQGEFTFGSFENGTGKSPLS